MDASQRAAEDPRRISWFERLANRSQKGTQQTAAAAEILLPSFFVVGPPRTGTSWLHEVLRGKVILPSPTKETRFFDTHFNRGLDWYRAHYPERNNGQRIGEIAPTYFASPEARERIAELVPAARVVCIFRDPVDRLVSLYRIKRAYGLVPWNFEQALIHDAEFLETSRYSANLKAWHAMFGNENVLATIYDDLRSNPQSFLNRILDFVGIPRFALTPSQKNSVHGSESLTHPRSFRRTRNASRVADWLKAQRMDKLVAAVRNSPLRRLFLGGGEPFGTPSTELSAQLRELFLPEINEMERILMRDLSAWKYAKGHAHVAARVSAS
jgi:hypothetical protein